MSSLVRVHLVVEGPSDAPALIFSNSLGSTLVTWDPQARELSRDFRVVRYDHRGHGDSPVPAGPYQISDLGGDVLWFMDRLGISRAHFCGLSMGGMVGMWLGAHAPDRIDRLVLLCTSARFAPAEAWAKRAVTVRARGTGAVADAVVGRWFTPPYAAANPDVIDRMRAMIAATPAEGYAACCGVVERTDLYPDLPSIKAPTLVIAGADDPAAPPDLSRAIAAEVPDSRVAVVEHAAHLANLEQPRTVTNMIRAHIADASREEEP